MPLTVPQIEFAQPRAMPYKLSDGGGMYLLVTPTGGKYWRLKYRHEGKENRLSLGVYPDTSIDDARAQRIAIRALLADGIDPSAARKAELGRQRQDGAHQIALTRFLLDSRGALSFRLGSRCLSLTPTETAELRAFLDATRAVIPKMLPCP